VKIRKSLKLVVIAAIVAVLSMSTVLITGLAGNTGFIRSLLLDRFTVRQHEKGHLPHTDPLDFNRLGVYTKDDEVIEFSTPVKLESLEQAQAFFPVPLMIPTYFEKNEDLLIIRIWPTNEETPMIELNYWNGYIEPSGIGVKNSPGQFSLSMQYLGDKKMTFDTTMGFFETKVNEYDAIWFTRENAGLQWVQDGIFFDLSYIDLSMHYLIKIAESLVPYE